MIQANELRIGNNLYDAIGNVGSVVISGNSFVLSTEDRGYVSLQECAPIPITPELVNSIKQFKSRLDIYVGPGELRYKDGMFYFGFTDNEYGFDFNEAKAIPYLHQLQNLYFALTQTELQIEL
jgi:hypothetical protein